MRLIFPIIAVLGAVTLPAAAHADRYLTPLETGQVETAKQMLGSVHKKSLKLTVTEIENAPYTTGQLILFKAMAKTFKDITAKNPDLTPKQKERIYEQILLRAAYIQFGGNPGSGSDTKLGLLIQETLLKNIPKKLLADKRFVQSLN